MSSEAGKGRVIKYAAIRHIPCRAAAYNFWDKRRPKAGKREKIVRHTGFEQLSFWDKLTGEQGDLFLRHVREME